MRESGLCPTTCNLSIRAFNPFLSWLKANGHLKKRRKIKQLREEKRAIKPYSDDELHRILAFRPKDFYQWRLYAMASTLIDTGLQIDEAISLRRDRVDLDNLLIIASGRILKQRISEEAGNQTDGSAENEVALLLLRLRGAIEALITMMMEKPHGITGEEAIAALHSLLQWCCTDEGVSG